MMEKPLKELWKRLENLAKEGDSPVAHFSIGFIE